MTGAQCHPLPNRIVHARPLPRMLTDFRRSKPGNVMMSVQNPYPYAYPQHKMCGKNFIYALHECDIHCCWAQSLTHCLPALFMPLHDKMISNNPVSKPYHFTMVEAVEPFKLHPTSMSHTYIRCVGGTFSCCGWAYGCTHIPYHYHHRYLPRFERIG